MLAKTLVGFVLLCSSMAFAAVDVNKGTEAELDGIKGIGPSTSAKILAEREKSLFKDWRDLMVRVKGIKPASASRLSANGLTVADAPYTPSTRP